MSASFAAATSGSSNQEGARRPSLTRTLLTGYPSLHEARTLVMAPVVGPPHTGSAVSTHAPHGHMTHSHPAAGPSSARVRAALDEMSLVLPQAPSPEAARLAAFESARRLVARDAMELQSGIAVASDETLDCVLDALRSAEGLDERALAPAAAVAPASTIAAQASTSVAPAPASAAARGVHATSVMPAAALPGVVPSVAPSARRPRLLRTVRIPPSLSASSLSAAPLARRAPPPLVRRAPVRTRGRGATFGALATLGVLAGAALAWLVIGTPQVLARSTPAAAEMTAAAP